MNGRRTEPERGRGREFRRREGGSQFEEGMTGREVPVRRKRVCPFCAQNVDEIDYKQADVLRQFVTERGKIKARRKSAVCARHQRRLAVAIKRARILALLPYIAERTTAS